MCVAEDITYAQYSDIEKEIDLPPDVDDHESLDYAH